MNELIGKKVLRLFINNYQSTLIFETDSGDIIYVVEGDCCSQSWFADITGVSYLLGHTVTNVEEVDIPSVIARAYENDGRGKQEYDQVYGYRLTVDNQRHPTIDIIFRNSSNGYYGGWMEYSSGTRPENVIEITKDWSA